MSAPDIRGIIFDMDGVIADTVEFHYQSWVRVAEEVGVTFTREKYRRMTGRTRDVNLAIFTEDLDIDQATKRSWQHRKNQYFLEHIANMQPGDELPGVLALLDDLAAHGLPVGVGSSSRNARPILQRLNLIHRFAALGDGATVVNSKPAPDIFLWVAGGLGISPKNILVLEDSQAGVTAAKSAGSYVIGLGDETLEGADALLPSLEGIMLSDLLVQLAQAVIV
ncbi:MAG: beta-phosphoglucomutase family hydrolase [Anaerolineae bacterium]|nr:beta-phosphoglucomutase family hydrolase [Anaerolineae bacterium]